MNKEYEWRYESDIEGLDEVKEGFISLIKQKASETEIDNYITKYPIILSYGLSQYSTGHHGVVVVPKQIIKPPIKKKEKGLIPDFIMGGRNSDGAQWWVIELKGADVDLFKISHDNKINFSDTINKGICQLLEYIDFATENQSFLRDYMKLDDFREPNGLLIVGTEEELLESKRKQKLKSAWNRLNRGRLEIRTYDWLIRKFEKPNIQMPKEIDDFIEFIGRPIKISDKNLGNP